jgi:predicted metalloprotease with PDZ domain
MIRFVLMLVLLARVLGAQHPFRLPVDAVEARYARSQPIVHHVLRVRESNLGVVEIETRIRNVPDTFRIAMAKHPEYDDRYWRFVEGLEVRGGSAARLDSALWQITTRGGTATITYRVRFPAEQAPRAAWRPFLAPTGGLVGGPHVLTYVIGHTLAPSHVTLELPAAWEVATALPPTSDPRTFFAPSADVLMESPILVGKFRSWRFAVDGVPHRVVYWPLPNAVAFDTTAFVGSIERLAQQAVALFGRAPYREYTFLFQDGAFGGLEHPSSVTLGAPSANLASNPYAALEETAHEFIHTWNLMRIRPAEYRGVTHLAQEPTPGLWFSEGLSMFYADLLPRRAELPVTDSTRLLHLERQISRYLSNPGHGRLSPERVSRAEYGAPPGSLGDYDVSVHLQGELLGAMLDFIVRDATRGERSMDDVMRAMLERFSGERGFTGRDIEQTVHDVCGCDVHAFFEAHVRGVTAIDFGRYLRLAGLTATMSRIPALARDGAPAVDMRVRAWVPPNETAVRLLMFDPSSAWGKAGLHTGDRVRRVNGAPMATWNDFRGMLSRLRVGDTVQVEVERPSGPWRTSVVIAPFDRPVVRVDMLPNATERQRAVRARWLSAAP